MDAQERLCWELLWEDDPDTLERRDFMLAQIASVDANVNSSKTKTTEFMPYYKPGPVDQKLLAAKIAHTFGMVAAAFDAAEEARKTRS